MIKLVVTDIDGTLLPEGSMAPPMALKETVKKCLDAGIVIVLASGRPLSALDSLFPEQKNRLIYICSNGSKVVQAGKTISFSELAKGRELAKLMEHIRGLHCDFMVDTLDGTLVETQVSSEFYDAIRQAGIDIKTIEDVTTYSEPIVKISIAYPKGPAAAWDIPFVNQLCKKYTMVATGGIFFDIMPLNVDKGTSVRSIQQKFEIRPEETVVFGNAMNDVSMFGTTPNSYAVENAPDCVKAYANHRILPPEQDGVWRYLSSLLEQK